MPRRARREKGFVQEGGRIMGGGVDEPEAGVTANDGQEGAQGTDAAERLRLRRVAAATCLLARELDEGRIEACEHADALLDGFVRLHELCLARS
jgi:hypothetical protein